MTSLFVYYRQEEAGMPYGVGGKGFFHPTQQVAQNRRDRMSLQGSFVGQELASADRRS